MKGFVRCHKEAAAAAPVGAAAVASFFLRYLKMCYYKEKRLFRDKISTERMKCDKICLQEMGGK